MNPICLSLNLLEKDPSFQELCSWYPDKTHQYLLDALAVWQEYYDRPDTFPTRKADFTRFLRHTLPNLRSRKIALAEGTLDRNGIATKYSSLLSVFTARQLEDRVDMVAKSFSSVIDGYIARMAADPVDPVVLTRDEAIRELGGVKGVMRKVFDSYNGVSLETILVHNYKWKETDSDEDKESKMRAARRFKAGLDAVYENRERLAMLALPEICDVEGIKVRYSGFEMSLDSVAEDDSMSAADDHGTKGDRYIDYRTVKPSETVSAHAKQIVRNLKMVDADGHVSRTDLDTPRMLKYSDVKHVLNELLKGASPADMMGRFKAAVSSYPWIQGLINHLDAHPEDRTTIFVNFRMSELNYTMIGKEFGGRKYNGIRLNSQSNGLHLLEEMRTNMSGGTGVGGSWSVYDTDGRVRFVVKRDEEGRIKRTNYDAVLARIKELSNIFSVPDVAKDDPEVMQKKGVVDQDGNWNYSRMETKMGKSLMQKLLDTHHKELVEISDALKALGMRIEPDELMLAAMRPIPASYKEILRGRTAANNRLGVTLQMLEKVYGRLSDLATADEDRGVFDDAGKDSDASKYTNGDGKLAGGESRYMEARAFFTDSRVEEPFRNIAIALATTRYDDNEPTARIGIRTYSTWVQQSMLSEVFDGLADILRVNPSLSDLTEDQYKTLKAFTDRYLGKEGFTLDDHPIGLLSAVAKAVTMYEKEQEVNKLSNADPNYDYVAGLKKASADTVAWARVPQVLSLANALTIYDSLEMNGVEYGDMDDRQHMTLSLLMFMEYNAIEVPIQSDYNISKYIGTVCSQASYDDIVDALVDEVLAEAQRIDRLCSLSDDERELGQYEESGRRFCIFPEMNSEDFLDKLKNADGSAALRELVRDKVAECLDSYVLGELRRYAEAGVLDNPMLPRVESSSMYRLDTERMKGKECDAEGNFKSDYDKKKYVKADVVVARDGKYYGYVRDAIARLSLESLYTRLQVEKHTVGGLQHFKSVLDLEKRSMMNHAPRSAMDTQAMIDGVRVGKDSENVVYLEDDNGPSSMVESIRAHLEEQARKGNFSASSVNGWVGSYGKINATDGMGVRTLESYRSVRRMMDKWSDREEQAYQRIMYPDSKGAPTKEDYAVFMFNVKPVYTGWETVTYADGTQVLAPVLHKYSEMVLLPSRCYDDGVFQMGSAPLKAMALAAERMATEGMPVDLFLFNSGVKVGGSHFISPFAVDKGTGQRRYATAEAMSDCIVGTLKADPKALHTLPYSGYGETASLPPHVLDNKISWSAQAYKLAFGNIRRGDTVTIGGETYDALEARDLFHEILAAICAEDYVELERKLGDAGAVEKLLQEELAGKSYSSPELAYALTILEDGRFALPLFSSGVSHDVQELFTSLFRSRLARHKTKGANVTQVTSLGLDNAAFPFEDDVPKLSVVYNDEEMASGKETERRVKYVEAYMALHDSRLLRFADEHGFIGPERLAQLVKDGVIPASVLECVGYRTPSDAEHSVIPIRIKGFMAAASGANIILPREVMVMTGHDYDGDKMRIHFKDFDVVPELDIDAMSDYYEKYSGKLYDKLSTLKASSDREAAEAGFNENWDSFVESVRNHTHPQWKQFTHYKVQEIRYDFGKSLSGADRVKPADIKDGSRKERMRAMDNALVELVFAQLTSPSGSARMLIPGGGGASVTYAKAIELSRRLQRSEEASKAVEKEFGDKVDLSSPVARYYSLTRLGGKDLDRLLDITAKSESHLSLGHSIDAFSYQMGGASLIDVYALYNSAFSLLQGMGLSYIPRTDVEGKNKMKVIRHLSMFGGRKMERLFAPGNFDGDLAVLALSHLLNDAVDNGKDPVLGYIGQTKDLAPLTFLMIAAGYSEEQVHLFMNQPAVVELARRMADPENRKSLSTIALELQQELFKDYRKKDDKYKESRKDYGKPKIKELLNGISSREESTYADNIGYSYDYVRDRLGDERRLFQMEVLEAILQMDPAASELSEIVRTTRPEASTASVGPDIAKTASKYGRYASMVDYKGSPVRRIGGKLNVYRKVDVQDGSTVSQIRENAGETELPQVTLLAELSQRLCLSFMSRYFPQAREDWLAVEMDIAGEYDYRNVQDGCVRSVGNDMILWKMCKMFSQYAGGKFDSLKEMREHYVREFPNVYGKFRQAVFSADSARRRGESYDEKYAALADNELVRRIICKGAFRGSEPYLRFEVPGTADRGLSTAMRSGWDELVNSSDKEIAAIGRDLVMYTMFTTGLNFARGAFGHYAPFSAFMSMPKFMDAMWEILDQGFSGTDEIREFRDYYYMNHWDDTHLVPRVAPGSLPKELWDDVGFKGEKTKHKLPDSMLVHGKFMLLTFPGKNDRKGKEVLVKYTEDDDGKGKLTVMAKLGSEKEEKLKFFQYDPFISSVDARSVRGRLVTKAEAEEDEKSDGAPAAAPGDATQGVPSLSSVANIVGGATSEAKKKALLGSLASNLVHEADASNDSVGTAPEGASPAEDVPGGASVQSDTASPESAAEQPVESVPGSQGPYGLAVTHSSQMLGKLKATGDKMFSIARVRDGETVVESVPTTVAGVREARRQRVYVRLGDRLERMFREKGFSVGILTEAEERLGKLGVTDFDRPVVLANGLIEAIRVANGMEGRQAEPEEFAHLGIRLLGDRNNLVNRLRNLLMNDQRCLLEAYGDQFDQYWSEYGGDMDLLVEEAMGKLVADAMYRQQEAETGFLRRLVHRLVEAVKSVFRRFTVKEVQDAFLDANEIASKLARDLLSGRLLDSMEASEMNKGGRLDKLANDITEAKDIKTRLLKTEMRRLAIHSRRYVEMSDNADGEGKAAEESPALRAAREAVESLNSQVWDGKTQLAVMDYVQKTLDVLREEEVSLNAAMGASLPMNEQAARLNELRDTLTSYSSVATAIRDAIDDGELLSSPDLLSILDRMEGAVGAFYEKYRRLSHENFEAMLTSVYGEHGVTAKVGRQKGRTISIREMATRAERDVSIPGRLFNSIADSGDLVLAALDDVVRRAKFRARKRTEDIAAGITSAVADLVRATGSRDQSFMYERDASGHKTGKYISAEKAALLPDAQRKFYKRMMELKQEADRLVPPSYVNMYGGTSSIVMVRKDLVDRVMGSEDVRSGLKTVGDAFRDSILDTSDQAGLDTMKVTLDMGESRIDTLPLHYLAKGKNESFDDMTEDTATSILAYVGMANEYSEMNNVLATIENARYASMERDVVQRSGGRRLVERIEVDGNAFGQDFTVKQARTNIQKMMDDFFQMHVYGHLHKYEGSVKVFGKDVSMSKVVSKLNNVTSLSQMALNFQQRISNILTGRSQIVIEADRKGRFSRKDVVWADGIYAAHTADRLMDTGSVESDDKLSLWRERFDVGQENSGNLRDRGYGKNRAQRTVNTHLLYAGLLIGEDALSSVTSLALARNFRMKGPHNEEGNLWDAYEVAYRDPVNETGAYLKLKDGWTKADGSPLTADDEYRFMKMVAGTNFDLQGIYNVDDRSAIMQSAFGSLIIMYRKWIAPAIKRRYAGLQPTLLGQDYSARYNPLKETYEEGYYTTTLNYLIDTWRSIFKDGDALVDGIRLNWDRLDDYEKSNVRKACREMALLCGIILCQALLEGLPDDDDKPMGWGQSVVYYQLLRLRNEIGSQAPTFGLVKEGLKILNSPFAALKPLKAALDVWQLFWPPNYFQTVRSGRFKGHTKAYKYFWSLPVLSMVKQFHNLVDPSGLIQYYKNDRL